MKTLLIILTLIGFQAKAQNTVRSCEENSYRLQLDRVHVLKFQDEDPVFSTRFQSFDRDGFSPEIPSDVTCASVAVSLNNKVYCKSPDGFTEVGRVGGKVGVDHHGQYFAVIWNDKVFIRTSLDRQGGCKYAVAVK